MKRYALALVALAVLFSLITVGVFFLTSFRLRMAVESLAAAAAEDGPEAVDSFSGALIKAKVSSEQAKKGRETLKNSSYSTLSIDGFMGKALPDGLYFFVLLSVVFIMGAAAAFLIIERKRRMIREEERIKRIGSALRGESVFRAESEDERDLERLLNETERLKKLNESSAGEMRKYVENVAHEIRTPTSGILLNLDLIEREGVTERRLSAARGCAARIDAYVSALLSLARIRSGRMRMSFEEADLGELAREAAAELSANGVETEITGEAAYISGDRVRIKEAVRNLIMNASKHQENDRPVRVELSSNGEEAALTVMDDGPGIKDRALPERYSVGREDGSSFGIGLSLAKEVAARHSGKLLVKRPENGFAIELVIPRFELKTSI